MTKRMFAAISAGLLTMIVFSPIIAAADSMLIAFSSSQCPPCEAMKPTLASLDRAGIPVRYVDVHSEPQLVARFGIRQTPTFVVLSSGKEVTRLVGMQSAQSLRDALAIDPRGPLVQTRSTSQSAQSSGTPQTHLAPLRGAGTNPQIANSDSTLSAREQLVSVTPSQPASEPMPSMSLADAIERARAATVRLRVHDGQGYGTGTGTIIDTHGEEALVLTCGHLFRETQGKGKIEVDLFMAGQTRTVAGQVVDFDADARDIALVSIRPGFAVKPVQVVGSDQAVQNGQAAFSFGCDRGADPSRRDTRITGVNKYNQRLGVSNLEIAGAPIDGRSGGGLFDAQGRLVGVCNSADYQGDVGIYAGPGNIRWQLERIGMLKLLDRANVAPTSAAPVMNLASANPGQVMPQPANHSIGQAGADQEVIVIIRDRNRPTVDPRVLTLQPSSELMQLIEAQAR